MSRLSNLCPQMLREKGGGGGLHVSAPIAHTAPPALRGLSTTDRPGRRGGARISGWLEKLTPGLNFKRERELSERGNEGEGERKRTLQAALDGLHTQNANDQITANACTEFNMRLARFRGLHTQ